MATTPGRLRDPKLPEDLVTQALVAKDVTDMSEEQEAARQALQESMDLRDQGHTDD